MIKKGARQRAMRKKKHKKLLEADQLETSCSRESKSDAREGAVVSEYSGPFGAPVPPSAGVSVRGGARQRSQKRTPSEGGGVVARGRSSNQDANAERCRTRQARARSRYRVACER